jgi:hypothetical protein
MNRNTLYILLSLKTSPPSSHRISPDWLRYHCPIYAQASVAAASTFRFNGKTLQLVSHDTPYATCSVPIQVMPKAPRKCRLFVTSPHKMGCRRVGHAKGPWVCTERCKFQLCAVACRLVYSYRSQTNRFARQSINTQQNGAVGRCVSYMIRAKGLSMGWF